MLTCFLGGLVKIEVSNSPRIQDRSRKEAHHGGFVPTGYDIGSWRGRCLFCLMLSVIPLCMVGFWPIATFIHSSERKFHFNIAEYDRK